MVKSAKEVLTLVRSILTSDVVLLVLTLTASESSWFAVLQASKLKKLNFAYNGLGPINGCKELTIGIKSNLILEELDLSDNRISPEGAVLLGKGLQVNASLKTLKMDRNPLQSAGCYVILNFIIKNPNKTLKVLTFEDIEVNESFRLLEGQALTALPDLTIVYGPKSRNKELSWISSPSSCELTRTMT
nr:unnamed protein product [Spirometra erinaceieuropaei]